MLGWTISCQRQHCMYIYIWLNKGSANERMHHKCNVSSHWLRPHSAIDRKCVLRAIIIEIRYKFCFISTPLQAIISLQNFVYAMAAILLCHVENFLVITSLQIGWEQNEISIEFDYDGILCVCACEMGPWYQIGLGLVNNGQMWMMKNLSARKASGLKKKFLCQVTYSSRFLDDLSCALSPLHSCAQNFCVST